MGDELRLNRPANPVVAILGPTAIGKSRLAMQIAERLPVEIISVDSRQIYRHLSIGTAKPTPDEQRRVPHHLIDILEPDESYSVARFVEDADSALHDIAQRGRIALLVGGTGYYATALLQGRRFPHVPWNEARRARLEAEVQSSPEAALERIRGLDPETAARIDAANCRRLVRALEILEHTGRPIDSVAGSAVPALVLSLELDRGRLYARADQRCEQQFSEGLVEETRSVLQMGFLPTLPVLRGLAYGQAIAHLEGSLTRVEAIHRYQLATHHLIRRQETWFRHQLKPFRLDAGSPSLLNNTLRLIDEHLKGPGGP